LDKVQEDIDKTFGTGVEGQSQPYLIDLCDEGVGKSQIMEKLSDYRDMGKFKWENGKISGTVYHGGDDLTELTSIAYKIFEWSNPLHPDLFPGVRKMEAEIVAMLVNLYNGDPEIQCGTLTSGGTESIIMACKTYRDWGREEKGITNPNMVIPFSAHAAFDKAGEYLGVEVIHAPLDPITYQVDVKKLRKLINRDTIFIVGSCPNYPYGVYDDITALGQIALKKGIGLHVDCCLGGFIAPFMEAAGYSIPPFDFRVEGATSISCDTHKYGFAPKGSSVIMYSTMELRKYQYFVQPNWVGGVYASPSMPGSRPGTVIAGCWAALLYFGKKGYVEHCKKIIETKKVIENGVKSIEQLFIFGEPVMSVIAFSSNEFNIYRVTDYMAEKGWNLNNLQNPPGVHITVTNLTDAETFVEDLKEVIPKILKEPDTKLHGSSALYGQAATIPDKSIVSDAIKLFIDSLYLTKIKTQTTTQEEKNK